jgi:hypothetical protein
MLVGTQHCVCVCSISNISISISSSSSSSKEGCSLWSFLLHSRFFHLVFTVQVMHFQEIHTYVIISDEVQITYRHTELSLQKWGDHLTAAYHCVL